MALNRGLISQSTAEFLFEVNKIRNNLAHRLGYEINFSKVFELAKLAALGGIDFSDDTIHQDRELSEEWYDVEGIIQEVFQNAAQDLSFLVEQNGGKFQFY
ncbi:glycyl-tRNA synthetase subunit alpha [Thalassospira xiamenensis]|nr:glycyl-tRNA synthetase subunit alpha [Thalassospira xiamenensis]